MNRRLTKHREAFLARAVKSENKSVIEGINRRFPEAWNCREKLELYKDPFFRAPLIYDEYLLNLLYCLFERANTHDELSSVLLEILIKKEAKGYKQLKSRSKNSILDLEEIAQFIKMEDISEELSFDHYCRLAILDYFIDVMNIQLSDEVINRIDSWIQRGESLLVQGQFEETQSYLLFKKDLRKVNSTIYKQSKLWLKQYSDYVGMPLSQLLCFDYLFPTYPVFLQVLNQLGTSLSCGKSRLTMQESVEVMCLLRCVQMGLQMESDLLHERLTDQDLLYIDEHLGEVVAQYVMMLKHEQDRDFFFKYYTASDGSSVKALEREIVREKSSYQELDQKYQILVSKLATIKEIQEKEMNKVTKSLGSEIHFLERTNDKLEQENAELKETIARLTEELSNVRHHSLEPVAFELENKRESLEYELEVDMNVINDPSILIVGGATTTVKRLKQKLPNCKYFEVDQWYNDHFFKGIKQAILLTNIINHGMTYRVDKLCPKIPKRSVGATNVDLIIKEIVDHYQTTQE